MTRIQIVNIWNWVHLFGIAKIVSAAWMIASISTISQKICVGEKTQDAGHE